MGKADPLVSLWTQHKQQTVSPMRLHGCLGLGCVQQLWEQAPEGALDGSRLLGLRSVLPQLTSGDRMIWYLPGTCSLPSIALPLEHNMCCPT